MINNILIYLTARLLLLSFLSIIISGMSYILVGDLPLGVILLLSIIAALPLGLWLLRPLHKRAVKSIKIMTDSRCSNHAQLREWLYCDHNK